MIDVVAAFARVKRQGDGWSAQCPAHDDTRNSLSISRGDGGRWLLKCHGGCTVAAVVAAAHLRMADLGPSTSATRGSVPMPTFDYRDEQNTLLFQVVRFPPKNFRQRAADGSWSVKGIRKVPYRLPELQGCATVCITEGEKDADALWAAGLPATTNAGGAGKWIDDYAQLLQVAGCRRVIVLPDNDAAGETHGRDVARTCVAAGLDVQLIPLPGLPPKGDVSDFLRQHSADDLRTIIAEAPPFNPTRPVAAVQPLTFTTIADFLSEPDDRVEWLVADRIPAGAAVLFVAPPKAGKSTAARELALAVSQGAPWLGWPTTAGPVWLLVFEDKRSEVRKHFRTMGADGTEAIRFFIGQAPADLLPQLHALAETERPSLIIVDTLARALRVRDFNDYATVTAAFEPLLKLTRTTGATLLLLYHSSVHVSREGLSAVLGSTAISGSVDNILILKRDGQQRVLSSVQRIGPDLEPTIIQLDRTSGRLARAGSKRDADDAAIGDRIVAALAGVPPVKEAWLQDNVEGKNADKVRVLRLLLGTGQVHRSGAGGRNDPYRYGLADSSCSRVDSSCSRDTVGTAENGESREQTKHPVNPGLFEASGVHVPLVPSICREQGNKNLVRTDVRGLTNLDSKVRVPLVPLVPDTSGNGQTGTPGTAIDPDKHCLDACSRDTESEHDDERL